MNAKLILQAAVTALVLGIGSGVLPASMSAAQAFQPIAAPWTDICDGLPQFAEWADPELIKRIFNAASV